VHGDKQQKGKDKDQKPTPPVGEFIVCYNGEVVYRGTLANSTLTVIWPPDVNCAAVALDAAERNRNDPHDDAGTASQSAPGGPARA
jgi:hypothetical protein